MVKKSKSLLTPIIPYKSQEIGKNGNFHGFHADQLRSPGLLLELTNRKKSPVATKDWKDEDLSSFVSTNFGTWLLP